VKVGPDKDGPGTFAHYRRTHVSKHIATLNLFQQSDGTYQITVAAASPDSQPTHAALGDADLKPVDHVENRVLAAAANMARCKRGDGTFREIPNGA